MSDDTRANGIPPAPDGVTGAQPLQGGDSSIGTDPHRDPAQAEWDETTGLDKGAAPEGRGTPTATGGDPAELPDDLDEIPREDLPGEELQPETQGLDPEAAEIGEEGQGDLSPEDL